jgi:hypothetical protein
MNPKPESAGAGNGVATSSSPFQSLFRGDEDIAASKPNQKGAVSRWARSFRGTFRHGYSSALLSCLLAMGSLQCAFGQDPQEPAEPPVEVPAIIEAVVAGAAAEVEVAEPENAADDGNVGEGEDRGAMPGEAQAAAAAAGGSNGAPASVSQTNGSSTSSRREGRSRERSSRDWRTSFGSAGRNKDGSTNKAPEIPKTDYAYFKVVNDRNIFNPARQPNRPDRPASREVKKVPKVDAFSLVGTLRYEKGDMAFFDGSNSDYRKAYKAGDSIAGFKVLSVSDAAVRIEAKGKVNELKIGSQMRREDEGEWEFASGPYAGGITSSGGSGSGDSASSSGSSGASTASSGSGSGGSADEILKRLLQKREQEMKNEK